MTTSERLRMRRRIRERIQQMKEEMKEEREERGSPRRSRTNLRSRSMREGYYMPSGREEGTYRSRYGSGLNISEDDSRNANFARQFFRERDKTPRVRGSAMKESTRRNHSIREALDRARARRRRFN